jgi:small-conductance mechanosensitive channel
MRAFFLLQEPSAAEHFRRSGSVVWNLLNDLGDKFVARLPYLVIGIFIFLLVVLIARLAKRFISSAARRAGIDPGLGALLARLAYAVLVVLGIFIAAVVVFPTFRFGDLIAGLGIGSIALGFAFKAILQNYLAGILILWRRPFGIGDQIRSGGYEGTVEEITARSTRLKTYDGERVELPNGDVYINPLLVRTAYDSRRVRMTVGVGYGDSIDEARSIIARTVERTEGVLDNPGPWVCVSELAPSSVNFTVYFWTASDQATVVRVSDSVTSNVKKALDRASIEIPYPHTVVLFERPGGEDALASRETARRSKP